VKVPAQNVEDLNGSIQWYKQRGTVYFVAADPSCHGSSERVGDGAQGLLGVLLHLRVIFQFRKRTLKLAATSVGEKTHESLLFELLELPADTDGEQEPQLEDPR